MLTKNKNHIEVELQEANSDCYQVRFAYRKPELISLKDLRSQTLGASIAPFPESGGTYNFTPP